jgi:hypothetical protein
MIRLRKGKIVSTRTYPDAADALSAAGLEGD